MPTTASVEEYLEAIYKLQQREHPVRMSRLATAMRVSAASVSEMSKRLATEGYVNRAEGVGVCLTAMGREAALKTVRKHRLVERFLTDVLGIPWDRVHEEACLFEHVLSDEVEEGIEKLLDKPTTCPHGYPIPGRDGRVEPDVTAEPLTELGAGSRATIAAVEEEDPAMLSYLASLGLVPKVDVVVAEVAPFGGPLLVEVSGARYALGREVASKVFVKRRSTAKARARSPKTGAGGSRRAAKKAK